MQQGIAMATHLFLRHQPQVSCWCEVLFSGTEYIIYKMYDSLQVWDRHVDNEHILYTY